jgi:hypothetical protein
MQCWYYMLKAIKLMVKFFVTFKFREHLLNSQLLSELFTEIPLKKLNVIEEFNFTSLQGLKFLEAHCFLWSSSACDADVSRVFTFHYLKKGPDNIKPNISSWKGHMLPVPQNL